jgi:hypothetical protein
MHDISACSAVPQPTAASRAAIKIEGNEKYILSDKSGNYSYKFG